MRQKIKSHLLNTYQVITKRLSANPLMRENLLMDDGKQARLLCQTRTIYFLVEYYKSYQDLSALQVAKSLYENTKQYHYAKATHWSLYPQNENKEDGTTKPLDAYNITFLLIALAKLSEYDNSYLKELSDVLETYLNFEDIEQIIEDFSVDTYNEHQGYSQNAPMHLFEALLLVAKVTKDAQYINILKTYIALFFNKYYKNGFILEFIPKENLGTLLWSEPGHLIEWCSNIKEYELLTGDKSYTQTHDDLLEKSISLGLRNGLILPRVYMDNNTKSKEDMEVRVWPLLELLYYYNKYQPELATPHLNAFFTSYVNKDDFVIEYIQPDKTPFDLSAKTTTIYHTIRGLVNINE